MTTEASAPPFLNRSIVVTGGTGTIGSEIVRQLVAQRARVIRVFSRDETKQAHLRLELGDAPSLRYLIGDVRDADRLVCAMAGVDYVFHAAALKHVPACEYNPFEAVQTNVTGTQNVIQACREAGVGRLVFVSTDKAVNPINTMGATKLLAENLVRASQEWNPSLRMSTVRFGNVLGSRGSLLPLLYKQAEQNHQVELTSGEMTRFMMTIADAVALVLEVAMTEQGGDINILKMPALNVRDLVEVFIEEYCERRGLHCRDIPIVETGVRAGEKIHEELVTGAECERLRELDRRYVVDPERRRKSAIANIEPARFCSNLCQRLDKAGIHELLARSGFFDMSPTKRAEVLA